jgi:hypothetical protein
MATSTAIGSGSTRNNSGVVFRGNTTSTSKVNDVEAGYSPANPRVLPKDLGYTNKAVSAGTFAYEQGATDRPITMYNDTIGGVANTAFSNVAADLPQARKHFNNFDITFKQDLTTSGIRTTGWHSYSGVFVSARQNQDVVFGADAEGSVGRTVAGEKQIKGPKFAVENKDYLTKVNG